MFFVDYWLFFWLVVVGLSGVEGLPEFIELFLFDLILDVLHIFS